ncbi:hypothetical protein ABVT39_023192 [Epinephelus coioides]
MVQLDEKKKEHKDQEEVMPTVPPWPFMDMIGLAERLPVLTDGADKWIMALEETTAGIQLALGDIKAIFTYVAGKQTTLEIFTDAHLSAAIGNNVYDDESFGHYCSRVWQQLRTHYPAKRDPSKLEGETMAVPTQLPGKGGMKRQEKRGMLIKRLRVCSK